jgi:hypothetical protein
MPLEFPSDIHEKRPGWGINLQNPDADMYMDFDAPIGKCSSVYLNLIFQLPKWGFDRAKIDEMIDVSPVFQQYYQLTMKQKQEFEAMIKAALASIATALSDLELLKHDLRKYKEFMDYFHMIDVGKKEKNEELRMRGEQALKAIFIDQVDAYTDLPNTPIALRSIVGRWPTIIADFMKLKDSDLNPTQIAKDYNVSEALAVVLSTKNKLYQEWRDELFRRTVEDRFRSLIQTVEARKKSYQEYKEMIKPTLKRYKSITDGIGKILPQRVAFWRPESQAMSCDYAMIWAWKPFAAPEKYKAPREAPLDEIPAEAAGFTPDQVKELTEKGLLKDGKVGALPVEPSIDKIVKDNIKKIEDEYKVKISAEDIYNAREKLVENFTKSVKGRTSYEAWIFSPYFMFFEIPTYRLVFHQPDGSDVEVLVFDRFKAYTITQNIMILRLIELEARDKQLDNYIGQMLGEKGTTAEGAAVDIKKIEEELLVKVGEEAKEKEEKKLLQTPATLKQVGTTMENFLNFFGVKASFFKARGPYEFILSERITKYYLRETGQTFQTIVNFIKSSFGVP